MFVPTFSLGLDKLLSRNFSFSNFTNVTLNTKSINNETFITKENIIIKYIKK